MPKKSVESINEAIAKLENLAHSKADHLKENIGQEYSEIKKALEGVIPYLEEIKGKVESEANQAKEKVEVSVKENPFMTLAIVGLVAFFVGLFFGRSRK